MLVEPEVKAPSSVEVTSPATVTNASDYTKWGASQTGDIVTAPGIWSLDNFGNKLIATISD